MPATVRALLDPPDLDRLRVALAGFTTDAVRDLMGLTGCSALGRGDLTGVARTLPVGDVRADLVRLFLLGLEVDERAARHALAPLPLERAREAGLIEISAGGVRARVDLRPYSEAAPVLPGAADGPPRSALTAATAYAGTDWWVVSDLGTEVRPGPVQPDHVLGVGAASLTLAQATPRNPVGRALDIGTGCGVLSLHLARHADEVVSTDVSSRALRFAATTAALSGQSWDLRQGSLTEPVAGEQFDLVVANPPFVVSGGTVGHEYRDGGMAGDGLCRALVRRLPPLLTARGTAQLLANWTVGAEQGWDERVSGWLQGSGCDAWVWQREVAEPGEYVTLWLRDTGERSGTARWRELYDDWMDWFVRSGVLAVGMGMITMWRTHSVAPTVVCEDVPQAVEQPCGADVGDWVRRRRWLADHGDDALLTQRLHADEGLVRVRQDLLGMDGWATASATLRQSHGMRWELEVDDAVASVVAACDGSTPLHRPVEVLASSLGLDTADVATAILPVIRDLVGRGILRPENAPPENAPPANARPANAPPEAETS